MRERRLKMSKLPKPSEEILAILVSEDQIKVIPKGIYCYDKNGLCPYWHLIQHLPNQLNGYCHLMKCGDWMELEEGGTSLLWDQVKECGYNREEDSEDE